MNNPNDSSLKSFIEVAPDSDFPIQNLPFGVFRPTPTDTPRIGVAIGDFILDLSVLETAGMLKTSAPAVFNQSFLNGFVALGKKTWQQTRSCISELLRHDNPTLRDNTTLRQKSFSTQSTATMSVPFDIRGYTDFYSSEHHASNVGKLFRDKNNPLLPNWKHLPVAYNGRASTVVVSGTPIRRPSGQLKPPGDAPPIFSPCQKLDFELELGFFVGAENQLGDPIGINAAEDYIFGVVLVNDWSARDIQSWEYVPLGPFLAKTFATTVSPWVVMLDALQPFRLPLPAQDPKPLPYLSAANLATYDIRLDVNLNSTTICTTNYKEIYWSMAQQLAHHAVNGCKMNIGDLLASGTISGADRKAWGSMLEMTFNGAEPIALPNGETRTFLKDGDDVTMRGYCQGKGYRIGFGEARGKIVR